MTGATMTLAQLLERFFTQRLMQQRQASPHTISSYRDTFRLLLAFMEQRRHKSPSSLRFDEIDAPLLVAFPGSSGAASRSPRSAPSARPVRSTRSRGRSAAMAGRSMGCSMRPAQTGPDGVQPVRERRHDATVPASAAQGPAQVGVLVCARLDEAAVVHHDLGGKQIVDGAAVATH